MTRAGSENGGGRHGEVMSLVMFLQMTGRGWAWRSPRSHIEELWGLDLPLRLTQQAEQACFDAVFLGSWLSWEGGAIGQQPFTGGYEPFTLLSALAARTEKIGLVATASTSFEYPFNVARFLASIDWLSNGRVGWNVVTSVSGGEHYGIELPPNEERYGRAQEYLDVASAFWDAWDDDAVIDDRAAGVWARADRIHPIDHAGKYYNAQGQLFMHRSPQGRPVIVQAGQSPAGMDFAARNAEVVFTAQSDRDAAVAFRQELRERAAQAGRDPAALKVLPGLLPTVGETAEEARAFESQLNAWTPIEVGLARAEETLQADLGGLDPDQPIPAERLVAPDAANIEVAFGSRYRNFYDMAIGQKMTLREIIARTDRNIGHNAPVGTAAEVADLMQEWYEEGACDGWAITPTAVPETYDAVCNLLMPELQRRGLARTQYEGSTLRDHLGLKRPASPRRASAPVAG
jgi:FMN-dependent oxidoreductase (nitrilotriacetate monooxygenase family)